MGRSATNVLNHLSRLDRVQGKNWKLCWILGKNINFVGKCTVLKNLFEEAGYPFCLRLDFHTKQIL